MERVDELIRKKERLDEVIKGKIELLRAIRDINRGINPSLEDQVRKVKLLESLRGTISEIKSITENYLLEKLRANYENGILFTPFEEVIETIRKEQPYFSTRDLRKGIRSLGHKGQIHYAPCSYRSGTAVVLNEGERYSPRRK